MDDHTFTDRDESNPAALEVALSGLSDVLNEMLRVPSDLKAGKYEHPQARLSTKRLRRIIVHEVNRVAPQIVSDLAGEPFEAMMDLSCEQRFGTDALKWGKVGLWSGMERLACTSEAAARVCKCVREWAESYNMDVEWWLDVGLFNFSLWGFIAESITAQGGEPAIKIPTLVAPAAERAYFTRPARLNIDYDAVNQSRGDIQQMVNSFLDAVEAEAVEHGMVETNFKKSDTVTKHVESFIRFQMLGTGYDRLMDELNDELPREAPIVKKSALVSGIGNIMELSGTPIRTGGKPGRPAQDR